MTSQDSEHTCSMDESQNSQPKFSRRLVLGMGMGAVIAGEIGSWLSLPQLLTEAAQTTDNVVIQWTNAALQAIRDVIPGPSPASRALAILYTCMYDAWTVYDTQAVPTH